MLLSLKSEGLSEFKKRNNNCKAPPIAKICHTYPAIIKLGTIMPYFKRIQKLYESGDTSLESC